MQIIQLIESFSVRATKVILTGGSSAGEYNVHQASEVVAPILKTLVEYDYYDFNSPISYIGEMISNPDYSCLKLIIPKGCTELTTYDGEVPIFRIIFDLTRELFYDKIFSIKDIRDGSGIDSIEVDIHEANLTFPHNSQVRNSIYQIQPNQFLNKSIGESLGLTTKAGILGNFLITEDLSKYWLGHFRV